MQKGKKILYQLLFFYNDVCQDHSLKPLYETADLLIWPQCFQERTLDLCNMLYIASCPETFYGQDTSEL